MKTRALAKALSTKKVTKAVIASAVGLALVTGGSTYAMWNATATANTGGTITGGDLQVTAAAAQQWSDVTKPDAPVAIPVLSSYRLTPGSSIELKQDVTAIATGNHMAASLKASLTSDGSPQILNQAVTKLTVIDKDGQELGTGTGMGTTEVVAPIGKTAPEGAVYTIKLNVTLPASADDTTKQQALKLSNIAITLQQGVES